MHTSNDIEIGSNTTFQCMSCGAPLKYKPGSASLHCEHCSSDTPIDIAPVKVAEELDFEEYAKDYEKLNLQATKVIRCNKCNAESSFDESLKSVTCLYCNNPLVESDMREERLIRASYLLPFHVADDMIQTHLSKWLKGLWFAPNKLKSRSLKTDELQGIYTPCWTYDAQTETDYTGERGDNYTVTVGSGDKRRTETRTRWTYCEGHVSLFFDDVMVPASKIVPQKIMSKISQWDTHNLVIADRRFMSGFVTEKYSLNLRDGFGIAKKIIEEGITDEIKRRIGGDHQKVDSQDTTLSSIKFKLILLPIYISSYTYKSKLYHFYVNGRSGKITGDRPYSAIKIALAVFMGIILILFILYLYNNSQG